MKTIKKTCIGLSMIVVLAVVLSVYINKMKPFPTLCQHTLINFKD